MRKIILFFIIILVLFGNPYFISSSRTDAQSDIFFKPSPGTTSTYTWNFTNIGEIRITNSSDQYMDYDAAYNYISIINPTVGTINITYGIHESFMVENVTSKIGNNTYNVITNDAYLIHPNTRKYVNISGHECSGYSQGFVFPFGEVGGQIYVGSSLLNYTAIEYLTVAGRTRPAAELSYDATGVQIKYYYDLNYRILLKLNIVYLDTGGANLKSDSSMQIAGEENRELINTNVFDDEEDNTTSQMLSSTSKYSDDISSSNFSNIIEPTTTTGFGLILVGSGIFLITHSRKRNKN